MFLDRGNSFPCSTSLANETRWSGPPDGEGPGLTAKGNDPRQPNVHFDLTAVNYLIQQPKPFVWTADPDKIIAAAARGHQVLTSVR
jgi:hypothetical protein